MVWDRAMKVKDASATPEQLQAAWDKWCKDAPQRRAYLHLSIYLRDAGATRLPCVSWPFTRLADRMLQKARKAGEIEYRCGRWHIVGRP